MIYREGQDRMKSEKIRGQNVKRRRVKEGERESREKTLLCLLFFPCFLPRRKVLPPYPTLWTVCQLHIWSFSFHQRERW